MRGLSLTIIARPLAILLLLLTAAPATLLQGARARADTVASAYSDSELRSTETTDEAKIRQLRDEEITQLRIALGRREPAHRRADLYFRLAEIYLEAYHSTFLLEGRVHEKRLEKGDTDKYIDRGHSRPYLTGGIAACQEIVNLGIPYAKMDRVIYFLAFNYGELGNRKESVKYHQMIVSQYPDSPFLPEAIKSSATTLTTRTTTRARWASTRVRSPRRPPTPRRGSITSSRGATIASSATTKRLTK